MTRLSQAPKNVPLRAVIFDCDGTLIDSEDVAWEALRKTLADVGHDVGERERLVCMGRNQRDVYRALSEYVALPDEAWFWPRVAQTFRQLVAEGLSSFPDAAAMLTRLMQRGIPVAVASSSSRERLDLQLHAVGIGHLIDYSVAGDEVVRGKPAPDIYLEAAKALGVAPSECLAVEDHPVGGTAAERAGCVVVQVVRGHAPMEPSRWPMVSSLNGLETRFEWLAPVLRS